MSRTAIAVVSTLAIMTATAAVGGTALMAQGQTAQTAHQVGGAVPASLVNERATKSLELAAGYVSIPDPITVEARLEREGMARAIAFQITRAGGAARIRDRTDDSRTIIEAVVSTGQLEDLTHLSAMKSAGEQAAWLFRQEEDPPPERLPGPEELHYAEIAITGPVIRWMGTEMDAHQAQEIGNTVALMGLGIGVVILLSIGVWSAARS